MSFEADIDCFVTTYVGRGGKVYSNRCVFVLIKSLNGKIKLYQENIFKKTNHIFIEINMKRFIT